MHSIFWRERSWQPGGQTAEVEIKSVIPALIIASIVGIVFAIIIITIAIKVYPSMHPNSYQNVQPTAPAQIVHDHTVYNNLSQDNTVPAQE